MTADTPTTPAPQQPVKKKGGIGKWILRLFGAVVILLILVVLGLYVFRNTLVKMGVERGGEYATLQKTVLENADLGIGSGTLELSALGIANPKPYDAKEASFLKMKSCKVGVETGTLLSNNVRVKEIDIDGLEVWLVADGLKTNLGDIIDIINKQTGGGSKDTNNPAPAPSAGGPEPGKAAPGKQLTIDNIKLTGTKVHVRGMVTMDLDTGPIEIKEPMNPDGRPMKIANVISTVLLHVAKQIAENPQLPGNLKDSLKNVDQVLNNVSKDFQKNFDKIGKDVGKSVQDATKGIDLKNLNPFDKKK